MWSRVAYYSSRLVMIVGQIVFFLMFLRFFIVEPSQVQGQSMEPTLYDDDFLLVDKFTPLLTSLHRFDIVQLFLPSFQEKLLVKRIIGFPGETVLVKQNRITVRLKDGRELQFPEPYLGSSITTYIRSGRPEEITIPPFSYFVMGDNRNASIDSRDFGPVHRRQIIGKVVKW